MTENSFLTRQSVAGVPPVIGTVEGATTQTATTQAAVSPTQPQPKLWETELFQLSAMAGILALLMIWASLVKKKPQLTSARMANRWDKLYATNRALEHMKATASHKCTPSAAWCGTPKYSYKFLGLKWASRLQVILHNTMPTTWIPDIGRGVLVLGSPGSGKTFSFIDRVIEALFAQGVSVLLYDKKGDQIGRASCRERVS